MPHNIIHSQQLGSRERSDGYDSQTIASTSTVMLPSEMWLMKTNGGEEDLTDNIMEYLVSGVTPTSLQSGRGEIAEELGLMV